MPTFAKAHFDTEGPFGLPMMDRQAKALEARLRGLPNDDAFGLRRLAFDRGVTELQPGERADVSWITEESPDRVGDVVLARGMDDAHFQLNPIVTLNHHYDEPPVGRSLWRKKVREGTLVGVKAKTHYPPKPEAWPGDWPPDRAFELVRAGLLRGKSIGFIPLKLRAPTPDEVSQRPAWAKVRYVIEEWLLAEYACCWLPMQPNAVVSEVAKSLPQLLPQHWAEILQVPKEEAPRTIPFTPLAELAKTATRLALAPRVESAVERAWSKLRGAV